jgi:hypothetical protein
MTDVAENGREKEVPILGMRFCVLTKWNEDNGTWEFIDAGACPPGHPTGYDEDKNLHTWVHMPQPGGQRGE